MANTWTTLLDAVYPVGAVYQSWSSTSPATLFGGTWVKLDDRFLYAADSAGTSGGSSKHLHSLDSTSSHISWANVDFLFKGDWVNIGYRSTVDSELSSSGKSFSANNYKSFYSSSILTSTESSWHGITLGGETQNSSTTLYPPYLTCCMWYRTA